MGKPIIEILSDGKANLFYKSQLWKRFDSPRRWRKVLSDGNSSKLRKIGNPSREQRFEKIYRSGDCVRNIRRFPRLREADKSADLLAIPTISQIGKTVSQWLIEGMILQGSINLLTAPPGGFKTWLSLWMGESVSTGTEFLSRKTTKTRVLYLDRENPPSVISERRDILNLQSEWFSVWGHWWKDGPPDLDDPRLVDLARQHRLLIIFDSFVRFHSADENSAKQMARILRKLRVLADAGATILILHHQAKSQKSQYRGSTDILAGVDAAFELCREKIKNDTVLSLKCFKHRVIPETTIKIRLNLQKGCFEAINDDSSNAIPPTVIEAVMAVIGKHRRITQTRLIRKAGLPETNGRRILQQGDGIHWVSKRGKGTTLHYFLKN